MYKKIYFILLFLSYAGYGQKNNFLVKGDTFYLELKTDSALTYFLKGLKQCNNCSETFVAGYYLKVGKLYKKQENQPKALSSFLKAEESWMQDAADQLIELLMETYNKDKAIVFSTLQMYRHDRLEYLKEGLRLAQEINYLQRIVDISDLLYGNSMNLRKYKEPADYMRIHYDSKEILFLKNNKRELDKFEDVYQLKKKDEQIESDRYRIKVQYFIIGTFLVLIVLFVFFLNKSSRDKKTSTYKKRK